MQQDGYQSVTIRRPVAFHLVGVFRDGSFAQQLQNVLRDIGQVVTRLDAKSVDESQPPNLTKKGFHAHFSGFAFHPIVTLPVSRIDIQAQVHFLSNRGFEAVGDCLAGFVQVLLPGRADQSLQFLFTG